MNQETQRFSSIKDDGWSSFRNTMNIITGSNLSSYTLLFLDPAMEHSRGSHISVDNRNLSFGRSEDCDIQYDQQFTMISREHCNIICEHGNVYLKHNPNASNPTLVNGVEATFVHELRNGDEIQLAYNGPKFRFNKAASGVKGMGITQRLSFAMAQAKRPLKMIIAGLIVLSIVLFGVIGVVGYKFVTSAMEKKELDANLAKMVAEKDELEKKLDSLALTGTATKSELAELRQRINNYSDRIKRTKQDKTISKSVEENKVTTMNSDENKNLDPETPVEEIVIPLENFTFPEGDIYMIKAISLTVNKNGKVGNFDIDNLVKRKVLNVKQEAMWSGAGILTKNKNLVTARHVIQPWRYENSGNLLKWLSAIDGAGYKLTVNFEAKPISGSGPEWTFVSDDVKLDDSGDKTEGLQLKNTSFAGVDFGKTNLTVKKAKDAMSDLAMIPAPASGETSFINAEGLEAETRIVCFGLAYVVSAPGKKQGLMAKADKNFVARYEGLKVEKEEMKSKEKFTLKKCVALDKTTRFDFGKSGGPVFAIIAGSPKLIGVVGYFGISRNCFIPFNGQMK